MKTKSREVRNRDKKRMVLAVLMMKLKRWKQELINQDALKGIGVIQNEQIMAIE